MNSGELMRRLMAGAVVLAVSGGAAAVTTIAATAAPGDGTLTILPATGTDQTVPDGTTSGPCPTTANAYNIVVQGPGTFKGTFTGTNASGFSTTAAFTAAFGQDFAQFAASTNQTIVAGNYALNLRCVNTFGQVSATFAGSLTFDDATHYHTKAAPSGTATPTGTPTSTATPTPSSTVTPTSTPTDSATTTTAPSTTSDNTTTTPESGAGDTTGASTPSDTSGGTQSIASTGNLANTGAPIALTFLGGLILLAAGLMLVVWMRRPRKAALSNWRDPASERETGTPDHNDP